MSETSEEEDDTGEEPTPVARTLSWAWQILGMLLGTATAISIIKNGFAIDVYGLPAKVLAQYIWLRETLFTPVVLAARYFGIAIAWWVKDAIMVYALVAAAHARARTLRRAWYGDWSPVWALSSRWGILFWPQITGRLVRQWARARADQKYFARHPVILYGRDPDRFIPLNMANDFFSTITEHFGQVGLQLVLISVATMAFFAWNYLSGLYGPT